MLENFSMLEVFVSYLKMIKTTALSKLSKLSERSKCSECQTKLLATEIGIEHDDYSQQLFRVGAPSIALHDFIFQTFSIIDFISPTIKTITKNAYVQSVPASLNAGHYQFYQKEWGEKIAARTVVNRYFNNEQRQMTRLEKNS